MVITIWCFQVHTQLGTSHHLWTGEHQGYFQLDRGVGTYFFIKEVQGGHLFEVRLDVFIGHLHDYVI